VYGDWSDTHLPCVCVDTTTKTFKFADHGVFSIDQVYKNGDAITSNYRDLTEATFRISESYTPGTDVITVKAKGRNAAGPALLENPVDILRDIQEEYVGIDSGDIDSTTYGELETELSDFECRRYIDEDISSNTLIDELAIECMFDLFIVGDKYKVRSRIPKLIIDREFDDTEVVADSMHYEADPEELYANRIKCEYNYGHDYDYDNDVDEWLFQAILQVDNSKAQTDYGVVIPRTIQFKWLYLETNVDTIAQHLVLLYAHEIGVIKFTSLGNGILTELSDRVSLTHANFSERPLHVREYGKHYNTMTCTIWAYDSIKHVLPGYWTADGAPDYDSSTDEQRATQGYWTDDDGYAKTGDEDSKVSHWW
jgi:hypothetical protein